MKKVVVFILVLIIVLGVGILIAGMILPNKITVSRSLLVKATKEEVFEQIVQFRNWPKWSPFHAIDTTMKITYDGVDGMNGSSYTWDSKNSDAGMGTMFNRGVSGTTMDYHIDIERPVKSTADGKLIVKDTLGQVKVTWTFATICSFPFNALQLFPFMNMDKMVGGSFEEGLAKLKVITEAHHVEEPRIAIKEVNFPAHIYEGIRKTVGWNEIGSFFAASYAELGKGMGDKIAGPGAGIFYSWDTVTKSSDLVASFPVADSSNKLLGCSFFFVDSCKAFVAVQKGGYSTSMKYRNALAQEVKAKGKTNTLVIEEYISGPHDTPDSSKWITNIYYLVR
jgi:Polyketide cyclase / dehydrase and lipid transport